MSGLSPFLVISIEIATLLVLLAIRVHVGIALFVIGWVMLAFERSNLILPVTAARLADAADYVLLAFPMLAIAGNALAEAFLRPDRHSRPGLLTLAYASWTVPGGLRLRLEESEWMLFPGDSPERGNAGREIRRASALALLIPGPGILFAALAMEASITRLIVAAFPFAAALYLILSIPAMRDGSLRNRWPSEALVLGYLGIFFALTVAGIATPTEAAALLGLIGLVFVLLWRGIRPGWNLLLRSAMATAHYLLIWAGLFFILFVNSLIGLPQSLADALGNSPVVTLVLAQVALTALALVLEPAVALVLVLGLTAPALMNGGFDTIFIAVVSLLSVALAQAARTFVNLVRRVDLPLGMILAVLAGLCILFPGLVLSLP